MKMTDLRAKIRELIASGALPVDPPPIVRPAPTAIPGNKNPQVLIGGPLHEHHTTGPSLR